MTKVIDEEGYKLKAGALVTKRLDGKNFLLLVKRRLWNDFTFPKGSIEEGETAEEASRRELEEEAGIIIEIVKVLPEQKYNFPNSGKVRVKMFHGREIKKIDKKTDEIPLWVEENDVLNKLSYDDLKKYYLTVRDEIYE